MDDCYDETPYDTNKIVLDFLQNNFQSLPDILWYLTDTISSSVIPLAEWIDDNSMIMNSDKNQVHGYFNAS